jgi:metal-sulfur cluster biosynthetic enzyme
MTEPHDEDREALRARILDALRAVLDPELGLDVVSLGLVYEVAVADDGVRVAMTMTTPACPLGEELVRDAAERLQAVVGDLPVTVELVWSPPWTPERMSAEARAALGWGR